MLVTLVNLVTLGVLALCHLADEGPRGRAEDSHVETTEGMPELRVRHCRS